MLDIYFHPAYGKLCEFVDDGPCSRFELNTASGRIVNQFIKRAVPFLIDGKQYYDIVTPYGYGGPVIEEETDREKLLAAYKDCFLRYCEENSIICEFIRYHPILKNYEDFCSIYHNVFSRHTVGTNLKDFDDPVQNEFSKSARKEVRRAERAGVNSVIIPAPGDLNAFRTLYEETMARNHADVMYYFPDEYYNILTTDLRDYVLEVQAHLGGEIIASEIYLISNGLMHAHLLGSSSTLLEISGGAIIEATAARWGKDNGYHYIHHGGGRSSAEDDPLYLYKKKFGKNTEFDFYTGTKIWNQTVYDKAVAIRLSYGEIENPAYFPIYRG